MSLSEESEELLGKVRQVLESAQVDGSIYNAGRCEGRADVAAQLRTLLDHGDANHWNLDGLLGEVSRLANGLSTVLDGAESERRLKDQWMATAERARAELEKAEASGRDHADRAVFLEHELQQANARVTQLNERGMEREVALGQSLQEVEHLRLALRDVERRANARRELEALRSGQHDDRQIAAAVEAAMRSQLVCDHGVRLGLFCPTCEGLVPAP
jgi:chromosome segregation ATPase